MQRKPPVCPHCGEPLKTVNWTAYEDYELNEETGEYTLKAESRESTCPKCEADLSEIFPDGPINYNRCDDCAFASEPNTNECQTCEKDSNFKSISATTGAK